MITRYCTTRTIRTLEATTGAASVSAEFFADGMGGFIPLSSEEVAWLRRMRAAGTPLVLTITAEPTS